MDLDLLEGYSSGASDSSPEEPEKKTGKASSAKKASKKKMVKPTKPWPNKAGTAKSREVVVRSLDGELVTGDLVRSTEEIISQTPNEVAQRFITEPTRNSVDASRALGILQSTRVKDLALAEEAMTEVTERLRNVTGKKGLLARIPIFGKMLQKKVDGNQSLDACIASVLGEFEEARLQLEQGIADIQEIQNSAFTSNEALNQSIEIMEQELLALREAFEDTPIESARERRRLATLLASYERMLANAKSIVVVNLGTIEQCGNQLDVRQELSISMETEGPVIASIVYQQFGLLATNNQTAKTAQVHDALHGLINTVIVTNAKETSENAQLVAKLTSGTIVTEKTITETVKTLTDMRGKIQAIVRQSVLDARKTAAAAEAGIKVLEGCGADTLLESDSKSYKRIGFSRK
jgi:hypothetical protein